MAISATMPMGYNGMNSVYLHRDSSSILLESYSIAMQPSMQWVKVQQAVSVVRYTSYAVVVACLLAVWLNVSNDDVSRILGERS